MKGLPKLIDPIVRRILPAVIMLGLVLAPPLALASIGIDSNAIHAMLHPDDQGMVADADRTAVSCESAAQTQAGSHDANGSGMHCVSCVLSCSASPFLGNEPDQTFAGIVPIRYGTLPNAALMAAFNDAVFRPPRISG